MRSSERSQDGFLFLIGSIFAESLFPLFGNRVAAHFPPVLFLALSTALVLLVLGLWLTGREPGWWKVTKKQGAALLFMSCVIALFFAVIFIVAPHTSSISTALVLRTEAIFTLIVTTVFFHERLTLPQCLGVLCIFVGVLAVLYNGTFELNSADLLLMLPIVLLPFMNKTTQWLLRTISPVRLLCFRYLYTLPLFLLISVFLKEDISTALTTIGGMQVLLIAVFSLLILCTSKLCWYQGIRRLPLGEAQYFTAAIPAVAVLWSALFLGEVPTQYQLLGCVLTVTGMVLVSRQQNNRTAA